MVSSKKIIVVVGATGNQGSSVAHTFLKLPSWRVRAVTRNPSSTASQALASLGAEVIQADLSDPSSLPPAFANANAIFVNTDFWQFYRSFSTPDSKLAFEHEVTNGKNAAHAAAAVPTLERFVYSALPGMKKHSKGKYPDAHHCDSKDAVIEYIVNQEPELEKKLSLIYLGAYTTNALLSPRFDPASGKYTFILPLEKNMKMPVIDAKNSTGPFVRALIEDEEPGTKLLAYDTDSYLTIGEIVELWSKASGMEAGFMYVTPEIMHQQFGIAKEILDSPAFMAEYGYMGGTEGWIEPGQLKKPVYTKPLEAWLKERDWKTVLESLNPVKST